MNVFFCDADISLAIFDSKTSSNEMFGSMDLVMINDSELAGLKPFSQIAKGFGVLIPTSFDFSRAFHSGLAETVGN